MSLFTDSHPSLLCFDFVVSSPLASPFRTFLASSLRRPKSLVKYSSSILSPVTYSPLKQLVSNADSVQNCGVRRQRLRKNKIATSQAPTYNLIAYPLKLLTPNPPNPLNLDKQPNHSQSSRRFLLLGVHTQ